MKTLFTYGCLSLVLTLLLLSCSNRQEIPSLRETYYLKDKDPFGGFVAEQQVGQLFYRNDVKTVKVGFESLLSGNNDTGTLYIVISKYLYTSLDDINSLLNFVSNGNTVFISSDYIDSMLLNRVNISQARLPRLTDFIASMHETYVSLYPGIYKDSSQYGYFYTPFRNRFASYPDSSCKVLGRNEFGEVNFLLLFQGKGRIYLHCDPRAFSNYFLLQKDNYQYLQQAFSFVPAMPSHVFWDDYYSHINLPAEQGYRSGLGVLLKYPAMAWAFWLILALLALFILFDSKRRQRVIKPMTPNVNTSVAFTETIGRLYLQKKDNRNIADKMISFFMEYIRNQYFLSSSQLNDELMDTLSRKANIPLPQTNKLFSLILEIQQSVSITDQQLLSLNQQIENFYKQKT